MIKAIITGYERFPTSTTILLLAERLGKSPNSVRAKLVSLRLYNRPDLLRAFYSGPLCVVSNGYMATHDESTICVVAIGGEKIFVSRMAIISKLGHAGATEGISFFKKIKKCRVGDIEKILVKNIWPETSTETVMVLVHIGECFGLDLFLPDILWAKKSA